MTYPNHLQPEEPLFEHTVLFWDPEGDDNWRYANSTTFAILLTEYGGWRAARNACPADTNGDGDCGRCNCPYCGSGWRVR